MLKHVVVAIILAVNLFSCAQMREAGAPQRAVKDDTPIRMDKDAVSASAASGPSVFSGATSIKVRVDLQPLDVASTRQVNDSFSSEIIRVADTILGKNQKPKFCLHSDSNCLDTPTTIFVYVREVFSAGDSKLSETGSISAYVRYYSVKDGKVLREVAVPASRDYATLLNTVNTEIASRIVLLTKSGKASAGEQAAMNTVSDLQSVSSSGAAVLRGVK